MGFGTIGWRFSKTDGVPVGLAESQWGCPKSEWGRLSMGMLQGVVQLIQYSFIHSCHLCVFRVKNEKNKSKT